MIRARIFVTQKIKLKSIRGLDYKRGYRYKMIIPVLCEGENIMYWIVWGFLPDRSVKKVFTPHWFQRFIKTSDNFSFCKSDEILDFIPNLSDWEEIRVSVGYEEILVETNEEIDNGNLKYRLGKKGKRNARFVRENFEYDQQTGMIKNKKVE